MWLPPLIGYAATLFVTLCGVQYHINVFKYPAYFSVPLTLAVYIPLSIVILLPLDYVGHNTGGPSGDDGGSSGGGGGGGGAWFDLPDSTILLLWKSAYWSTFALTWLLLPTLQEFYRSGHYHKLGKLKDALRRNLKYQAVIVGASVLGLVYLILEVGLSMEHVKLMIIAATHIYSLVIALWLMAHGLVSIPRNRWIAGNHVVNLNHFYLQLPAKVDVLEDTKISFKEDILKVLVLERNFTSASSPDDLRFRDWILELAHAVPSDLRRVMERQLDMEGASGSASITRDQLSEAFMSRLTSSFQSNLWKLNGYESEVGVLLDKIIELEDITGLAGASAPASAGAAGAAAGPGGAGLFRIDTTYRSLLTPRQRHWYLLHVQPYANRALSVALYAASFVIIESEFLHSTRFSLMNVLVYATGIHRSALLQLLATSLTFSYMLFASLNSLTRLKIFNMYHLVPHKSDPVSACFYATYIARLTIPLSYNFITLFISRASIFESWFGASIVLDRAGIFNLMNNWLPRLLLVPIVLTVFNVYDKVKHRLGLNSDLYDSWVFDDEEDVGGAAAAAGPGSTGARGAAGAAASSPDALQNKRKDLVITEAKRIVNREWLQRKQSRDASAGAGAASLRPFNLASAANQNYQNNLQSFNQSLANRIEYRDDAAAAVAATPIGAPPTSPGAGAELGDVFGGVWNSIGGAFSGIRENVASRFGNTSSSSVGAANVPRYRDDAESIEDFEYDNDNLVI